MNDYTADYYENYPGVPQMWGESHWPRFFATVAQRLAADLRPRTVLDVGCGVGFLVSALRQHGIEATGIDSSAYAISAGRAVLGDVLQQADAASYRGAPVDLVTCIEVAEHLDAQHAAALVETLCRHAALVLFSSTPDDKDDPTHINVQPPVYWDSLFAARGFMRTSYAARYLTAWATLYRRGHDV